MLPKSHKMSKSQYFAIPLRAAPLNSPSDVLAGLAGWVVWAGWAARAVWAGWAARAAGPPPGVLAGMAGHPHEVLAGLAGLAGPQGLTPSVGSKTASQC